jgi:hypothetical protein
MAQFDEESLYVFNGLSALIAESDSATMRGGRLEDIRVHECVKNLVDLLLRGEFTLLKGANCTCNRETGRLRWNELLKFGTSLLYMSVVGGEEWLGFVGGGGHRRGDEEGKLRRYPPFKDMSVITVNDAVTNTN